MASDAYQPKPEHKFSFGLWTVGNPGRDPFGEPVRAVKPPTELAKLLGEAGAWGVNLHDNDLVPIDATPSERDKIVKDFKAAVRVSGTRGADGDGESVYGAGVSRWGVYGERSGGARVCGAEDDARDGSRRGAGREDFRAVGRTRRHGDGCVPQGRTKR